MMLKLTQVSYHPKVILFGVFNFKTIIDKILKIEYKFEIFKLKVRKNDVFISGCQVNAVQDDISAKLFPSDCVTLYH